MKSFSQYDDIVKNCFISIRLNQNELIKIKYYARYFSGDCICAPNVTGPDDAPCTECMENTFGYNPITGCQECQCATEGTINADMSCDLESGKCK